MKKTELRKALDVIDRVLVKNDDTAAELWDVLSALRGPDDMKEYKLKAAGTVPIRRAAFPLTTEAVATSGFTNRADFTVSTYQRPEDNNNGTWSFDTHVVSHIKRAADALGLKSE